MFTIKRSFLLSFILSVSILAGCSGSKNFYLEPEYEANKVSSPITVLPVYQSLFSNFSTHTFGSLTGTGKNVFMNSLESFFSKHASTNVVSTNESAQINTSEFTSTKLMINEKTFDLIVPNEKYSVEEASSSTQFIVILDQFYFREKNRPPVSSSFAGQEQVGKGKLLYFETKYAYWDTQKKKIVGWGISSADTNLDQETPTESDYAKILSEVIEEIVAKGPVKAKP